MKFLWNLHIGLCVDVCFCLSWVSAFKWNCWLICTCIFHFIRNCPKCCKECDFRFPPAMHESCSFSRPCRHLIFVHLFNGILVDTLVIFHCRCIYIFLMTSVAEQVFMCCWLFVKHLLFSVTILLIFKMCYLLKW